MCNLTSNILFKILVNGSIPRAQANTKLKNIKLKIAYSGLFNLYMTNMTNSEHRSCLSHAIQFSTYISCYSNTKYRTKPTNLTAFK